MKFTLVRLEHEVDRDQDGTYLRNRKAQRGKGMRIAGQDGNAVAVTNANPEQTSASRLQIASISAKVQRLRRR